MYRKVSHERLEMFLEFVTMYNTKKRSGRSFKASDCPFIRSLDMAVGGKDTLQRRVKEGIRRRRRLCESCECTVFQQYVQLFRPSGEKFQSDPITKREVAMVTAKDLENLGTVIGRVRSHRGEPLLDQNWDEYKSFAQARGSHPTLASLSNFLGESVVFNARLMAMGAVGQPWIITTRVFRTYGESESDDGTDIGAHSIRIVMSDEIDPSDNDQRRAKDGSFRLLFRSWSVLLHLLQMYDGLTLLITLCMRLPCHISLSRYP